MKTEEYDWNKVDELTLALMHLVTWQRLEGHGARAWKGFEWCTLARLNEKGWISDPETKAKSVVMTEEGFKKAEELFNKHFAKHSK